MKRLELFGLFSIIGLLAISLVSAYTSYGGVSPGEIFNNEWIMFAIVFLIVFALSYFALLNFFAGKKKKKNFGDVEPEQKKILAIVALGLGLLAAVGFVQQSWLRSLLGDAIGGWLTIILLCLVVLITTPIYKALKENMGKTPATLAFIAIIWIVLRIFTRQYYFELPYETYNILESLSDYSVLVVALIIGLIRF